MLSVKTYFNPPASSLITGFHNQLTSVHTARTKYDIINTLALAIITELSLIISSIINLANLPRSFRAACKVETYLLASLLTFPFYLFKSIRTPALLSITPPPAEDASALLLSASVQFSNLVVAHLQEQHRQFVANLRIQLATDRGAAVAEVRDELNLELVQARARIAALEAELQAARATPPAPPLLDAPVQRRAEALHRRIIFLVRENGGRLLPILPAEYSRLFTQQELPPVAE